MASAAGAVGAALLLLLLSLGRLHRSTGFYAGFLVALALTYPLFAAERLDYSDTLFHLAGAAGFLVLATFGARLGSGAVLGLGFLLHALLDLIGLAAGFHGPLFWGEFCVGFDVVFALAARRFLPG
jgi:hypothetical protein